MGYGFLTLEISVLVDGMWDSMVALRDDMIESSLQPFLFPIFLIFFQFKLTSWLGKCAIGSRSCRWEYSIPLASFEFVDGIADNVD